MDAQRTVHLLSHRSTISPHVATGEEGVVMGQVMAFTFCSQVPQNISKHRHQVKQRERNASAFYHNGLRVCKRTFLFLHDIGDFRLKAIRAQYIREGLVPRVHGHTGRVAPNAGGGQGPYHIRHALQSCYLAAFQGTRGMTSSCSLPAAPNELRGCCTRRVQRLSHSGLLHIPLLQGVEKFHGGCCGL